MRLSPPGKRRREGHRSAVALRIVSGLYEYMGGGGWHTVGLEYRGRERRLPGGARLAAMGPTDWRRLGHSTVDPSHSGECTRVQSPCVVWYCIVFPHAGECTRIQSPDIVLYPIVLCCIVLYPMALPPRRWVHKNLISWFTKDVDQASSTTAGRTRRKTSLPEYCTAALLHCRTTALLHPPFR